MFSGIIDSVGKVAAAGPQYIEVANAYQDLEVGESISINGVCLTVTDCDSHSFKADISEETALRTTLGNLSRGDEVNLERALQVGGRLGGHIVQGHVDSTTSIIERNDLKGSSRFWLEVPKGLEQYLVEKGSVAVDGVGLTVSVVQPGRFAVDVIPHTLNYTNLSARSEGDQLNIEVDVVAKYLEGLIAHR